MSKDISDKVSQRIQAGDRGEFVKLRYSCDYGHGFLGLFAALFKGNIEEVIDDPGPPYVDKAHMPMIVRNLYFLYNEGNGNEHLKDIPKKYHKYICDISELNKPSSDCLFES